MKKIIDNKSGKSTSLLNKKINRRISGSKVLINIHTSFNNTIFTVTKENGEAIFQLSPRKIGFKGARKSTPYASQKTAEMVINQLVELGVSNANIRVKNFGPGRDSAQRKIISMQNLIKIDSFIDATGIAHGGVRHKRKPSK
ncbi:MAG TPA: 30S ribosomal protein S11 [Mycoplasmatales bacterium]|jgi:small subunit ribosomal protein S11|nr:30S ribosomal protein S11 [Mycoplasmatales bacterium]